MGRLRHLLIRRTRFAELLPISLLKVYICYWWCLFSLALALSLALLRGKGPEVLSREGPRAADIYLIRYADSALYEQNSMPGWSLVSLAECSAK